MDKIDHKVNNGFLHRQDGAVTVYLLLTGAALITLFLAVFNYGRFLLATGQAEQALEASLTSVLSYYEPELTREMGLYALDTLDLGLQKKGESYFTANLGRSGSIHGQTFKSYTLTYPNESRLDLSDILAAQAMDMQRIEGWSTLVRDVLAMINTKGWEDSLRKPSEAFDAGVALGLRPPPADSGVDGALGAGVGGLGGLAEGSAGFAGSGPEEEMEKPEWLKTMETNNTAGSGRNIKFWQFLSSEPPVGLFDDRTLPYAIANTVYGDRNPMDNQLGFWEKMFSRPSEAVCEEEFLGATVDQVSGSMWDLSDGLTAALSKGKEKFIFTAYVLSELDFATNKPALDRFFTRSEAEYILCGYDRSWDNLRSTALRLFLIRTGLHILHSALEGDIVDDVTLAVATVEGILKGSMDVERLFAGEAIPAIPGSNKVIATYKDHLRLLLLCRGEAKQREGLQKLVQANLWYWAGGLSGIPGKSAKLIDIVSGNGEASNLVRGKMNPEIFSLYRYASEVRAVVETELSLWPFGTIRIRREGVMGYDKPFTLLAS